MQLSKADIRQWPKFAYYVRVDMPAVRDVLTIITTIQRLAGTINRATIRNALLWGRGPMITIVPLPGEYGEFTPDIGSNEIRIDRDLVQEFEDGGGLVRTARGQMVYKVGVTLLHELTHWADDQDGLDTLGEEGEQFEEAIYGGVVDFD